MKQRLRKWDAEIYHKISHIQEAGSKELILNNKWNGDEVVREAGCGTGDDITSYLE